MKAKLETFFYFVWKYRTNTASQILQSLPKRMWDQKSHAVETLLLRKRSVLRARSCWSESTVLTEELHIRKKLPLASADLLHWVPLVRRMGPLQVKAVSDRQMWVIINLRRSHFGGLFSAFVQVQPRLI